MTKKLSVLIIIMLILSMLVGCTPTELEFYSLFKEMSTLKSSETEGTFSIDLNGSVIESLREEPKTDKILGFMDDLVINYKSQQSLNKNQAILSFEFKNKSNPVFSPLTTIVLNENVIYIELTHIKDYIIDVAKADDEKFSEALEEILKDVNYVFIDQKEFNINLNTDESSEELVENYFYIEDIFTEAFKNFDSKTITKEGNKLIYELNTRNLFYVIENFLTYIVENKEEIIEAMYKAVDSMPQDTLPISKEELKQEILDVEATIMYKMDELLDSFKEVRKEWEFGIRSIFKGSKIKYSIEKENDVFNTEFGANLNINFDEMNGAFNLNINKSSTIKEIKEDNFLKTPLVENAVNLNDLRYKIDNAMPYNEIFIDVDNQEYYAHNNQIANRGKINVVIKDNSTYLPLKQVREDLREEVLWDETTQTPYIENGSDIIPMDGLLIDGTAYIKIRDFEKLGYNMHWSEKNRKISMYRL